MTQDGNLESYFCAADDQDHPIAAKITETYGTEYDIEAMMCGEEKVPLGKIMLALQTEAISDYTLDELLDGSPQWGQIWQEIGLKGKPDHGIAPGQIQQQGGDNAPDDAGGEDNGNDQGASQSGKQ
jgi:hypothetical protein